MDRRGRRLGRVVVAEQSVVALDVAAGWVVALVEQLVEIRLGNAGRRHVHQQVERVLRLGGLVDVGGIIGDGDVAGLGDDTGLSRAIHPDPRLDVVERVLRRARVAEVDVSVGVIGAARHVAERAGELRAGAAEAQVIDRHVVERRVRLDRIEHALLEGDLGADRLVAVEVAGPGVGLVQPLDGRDAARVERVHLGDHVQGGRELIH